MCSWLVAASCQEKAVQVHDDSSKRCRSPLRCQQHSKTLPVCKRHVIVVSAVRSNFGQMHKYANSPG
jgi:hypothetical protein